MCALALNRIRARFGFFSPVTQWLTLAFCFIRSVSFTCANADNTRHIFIYIYICICMPQSPGDGMIDRVEPRVNKFERSIGQGTYVRRPVPPACTRRHTRADVVSASRDANTTTTAGREHVNGPIAAGPSEAPAGAGAAGPAGCCCHCPRTERRASWEAAAASQERAHTHSPRQLVLTYCTRATGSLAPCPRHTWHRDPDARGPTLPDRTVRDRSSACCLLACSRSDRGPVPCTHLISPERIRVFFHRLVQSLLVLVFMGHGGRRRAKGRGRGGGAGRRRWPVRWACDWARMHAAAGRARRHVAGQGQGRAHVRVAVARARGQR